MVSIREGIFVYLAAQLVGVTGATVYRSRKAAAAATEGTLIVLSPVEEHTEKMSDSIVIRDMTVSIILVVRGDVPDSLADAFLIQVQTAIMTDATLGGRAARCIERSTQWDISEADLPSAVVEVRYDVKYQTMTGSITG